MKKELLLDDMVKMEAVMERVAQPTDIWQDRCVYWIAKAVYDILQELYKTKKYE